MTTVPCNICGAPTTMHGTHQCDRCWELERRILCAEGEHDLPYLTGDLDVPEPLD